MLLRDAVRLSSCTLCPQIPTLSARPPLCSKATVSPVRRECVIATSRLVKLRIRCPHWRASCCRGEPHGGCWPYVTFSLVKKTKLPPLVMGRKAPASNGDGLWYVFGGAWPAVASLLASVPLLFEVWVGVRRPHDVSPAREDWPSTHAYFGWMGVLEMFSGTVTSFSVASWSMSQPPMMSEKV